MIVGETDPKWPKLLSLAAHELRSPLTVVGGYIRMLLKDRAGPLNDQQRRLMEEAEKSCGRLSHLVAEVSELAHLESGRIALSRTRVDLRAILADAIANLPDLQDREVVVDLTAEEIGSIQGDAVRLKTAFTSIVHALRRELVTSDRLAVHLHQVNDESEVHPAVRVDIAEPTRIDWLKTLPPSELATFDEWRGGNGLALPNARRILETHGGQIWSPAEDGKAGAIVSLPLA
jgi:signal transduction histidine kinase